MFKKMTKEIIQFKLIFVCWSGYIWAVIFLLYVRATFNIWQVVIKLCNFRYRYNKLFRNQWLLIFQYLCKCLDSYIGTINYNHLILMCQTDTLYNIFINSCQINPNNCAVIWDSGRRNSLKTASYKEVFEESKTVSKCLQELGARSEFVGIFMEQSIAFPAIVLGILDNRMGFTCINNNVIEEHAFHLIQRLNICWVFTDKIQIQTPMINVLLSKYGEVKKEISIHGKDISLWHLTLSVVGDIWESTGMAYAIQTSGTTGVPKIVQVPHKCIISNIQHLRQILEIGENDVIFLGTPLTFDPSVVELFLALACGAALLIIPSEIRASPSLLLQVLFLAEYRARPGVTVLQATPSVVSRWSVQELRETVFAPGTTLKVLLLGGEPCPSAAILGTWRGPDNRTRMFNVYGITEVSCWASIYPIEYPVTVLGKEGCSQSETATSSKDFACTTSLDICLGDPLAQTLLEVRDLSGRKVVHGEGEMYIGSKERVCIIDNEIKEELTPPVFRATGDIVRVDSQSGHLLFVGRKDRVVKRWGHRVSLLRVEGVCSSHPAVDRCCCIWDPAMAFLGLAIIIKVDDNKENCVRALRQFLMKHLHRAEFPDWITTVDTLPLTSHGKLNYEKIKSLILQSKLETNVGNDMSVAKNLEKIWSKYFGNNPKPEHTFLDSGGNSFLALQFATELEDALRRCIPNGFIPMLLMGSSFAQCCHYLVSESSQKHNVETGSSVSSTATSLEVPEQITSNAFEIKLGAVKNSVGEGELNQNDLPDNFSITNIENTKEIAYIATNKRKLEIMGNEDGQQKDILSQKPNINTAGTTQHSYHTKRRKCKCEQVIHENESTRMIESEVGNVTTTNVDLNDVTKVCKCLLDNEKEAIKGSVVSVSCRGRVMNLVEARKPLICGDTGSVALTLGWKFNLGKCVDASPCYIKFSSGKSLVVVGSHSHLLAILDGTTGTTVASCQLPDRIESSICISLCGRYGVLGCYDGKVYCVTLNSGDILWQFETGGMVKSSPVLGLQGKAVIVGSYDCKLYCISIQDGSLIWSTTLGGGSIFSSPCLLPAGGTVYIGTLDGTCAAVCERTGQLQWHIKLETPVFASPALLHSSNAVLFAEVVGKVHCFSANTGQKLWTFKANGNIFSSFSTQVIPDDVESSELIVFGCHDKSIYCLRCVQRDNSVTLHWRLTMDSSVFATPFIFPVITSVSKLWTAVATTRGTILFLDISKGVVECSFSLPHEVFSSPVVCDNRLVVGCRDNFVYCLDIVT